MRLPPNTTPVEAVEETVGAVLIDPPHIRTGLTAQVRVLDPPIVEVGLYDGR